MYAYNVTDVQLNATAVVCGLKLTRGNDKSYGKSFRLSQLEGTTKDSAYVPHSFNLDGTISRKQPSKVCIHGHLAFFKWLIRINPKAEIVSSWFGYVRITKDNLEDWYESLATTGVSPYLYETQGLTYDDACNCNSDFPHLKLLIEEMTLEI